MSKLDNRDLTNLVDYLNEARKLLEEICNQPEFIQFKNFPKGCCRVTCGTLGNWLLENEVENVRYVWGTKDSYYHAWLQIDDKIIDITADQFSSDYPKVIFSDKSDFHNEFNDLKELKIAFNPSLKNVYSHFNKKMNLSSIPSGGI